eukprot:SAG31_NODE_1844_length_7106_cov_3.064935_5_plen_82_part_00
MMRQKVAQSSGIHHQTMFQQLPPARRPKTEVKDLLPRAPLEKHHVEMLSAPVAAFAHVSVRHSHEQSIVVVDRGQKAVTEV